MEIGRGSSTTTGSATLDVELDFFDKIPDLPGPVAGPSPEPAPATPSPSSEAPPTPVAETVTPARMPDPTEPTKFDPLPPFDLGAALAHVRAGLDAKVDEEMERVAREMGALLEMMRLQIIAAHADVDRYKAEAAALRKVTEDHVKQARILRDLQARLAEVKEA